MRISDWSSDVCSSDLSPTFAIASGARPGSQTTRAVRGQKEAERDLIEALLGDYHGEPLSEIQKRPRGPGDPHRSEEHTCELQSLMRISYAVFCSITKTQLLLTSAT